MRISTNSGLRLAAVLIAAVLIPSSGWAATTKNCPAEPSQTSIASGQTYLGANCVLSTTGDLDKFTFTGAVGDVWHMVAGMQGTVSNICLELQAPNGSAAIPTTCTVYPSKLTLDFVQTVTVAGTYTLVLTETNDGGEGYAVSLERLSPLPPDAIPLVLGKGVTGTVVPTAQNAFTFYGDTIGVYDVTESMLGTSDNICFNIYKQGGTSIFTTPPCTVYPSTTSITEDITPTENATYLLVAYTSNNDGSESYNLQVSCLSGTCKVIKPKCVLTDTASYDAPSSTITMTFTLGTPDPVTWKGWLVSKSGMKSLWSLAQPITEPAATLTKMQPSVAASGNVGILSTLTTPTGGITCSSWTLVNTGKP